MDPRLSSPYRPNHGSVGCYLEKHVPIAATLDAKSNLAAQDRMRQIASDMRLVIPVHDPEVFNRFPKEAEGIVRLDYLRKAKVLPDQYP